MCVSNRRYRRSEIIGNFLCYGVLGLLQALMTLACTQWAAPLPGQRFLMYVYFSRSAWSRSGSLTCDVAPLSSLQYRYEHVCVSCDLRFSSRCCCCFMSDTIRQQLFGQAKPRNYSTTVGVVVLVVVLTL